MTWGACFILITLPHRTIPNRTKPYPTPPYRTQPYQTTPYIEVLCRVFKNLTTLKNIFSKILLSLIFKGKIERFFQKFEQEAALLLAKVCLKDLS